jgi:hypothetical protein
MLGLVVGALAAGLAVWYWRDEIVEVAGKMTRVRDGAASALGSVGKTAENVFDRTASTPQSSTIPENRSADL